MKYLSLLLLAYLVFPSFAQEDTIPPAPTIDSAFIKAKRKKQPPKAEKDSITIEYYKIISHKRDTTFLDTTLTIAKEYRFNYIRRDDFELMPFSNAGQPYNYLGVDLERVDPYPQLGARAKHYNYYELDDIKYYNVATPMTGKKLG